MFAQVEISEYLACPPGVEPGKDKRSSIEQEEFQG